jgi:hypothetical protein
MSPALAMSAAGAGAAGIVGRSVPLVFLVASIAILLVSSGFIYLSRICLGITRTRETCTAESLPVLC